jgi:hypothetical protein
MLPGTNPPSDHHHHHLDNNTGKKTPPGGGGGKKKRKPIEQKRAKRRTSNATNTAISLTISTDEHPDRIVNPLLEIPEPTSNGGDPVHGAELLALTELAFHEPDTYPVSYLARLLGFDVPVPETPVDFPTPLGSGTIESLPFLKKENDVFYQVPPAATTTTTTTTTRSYYRKVTDIGDDADQHTLDYMDPVYAYLFKHGFSSGVLKSPTSTRVAKFAAQQRQQSATRERVVQQAREILNLSEDWTFSDWTSFVEQSSLSSTRTNGRPRWTLDGTKVFSNPPPQAFGIIAMYKGKAVAVLKYHFLWYPLLHEKESEIVMVVEGLGKRTTLKETVATAKTSETTTPVTADALFETITTVKAGETTLETKSPLSALEMNQNASLDANDAVAKSTMMTTTTTSSVKSNTETHPTPKIGDIPIVVPHTTEATHHQKESPTTAAELKPAEGMTAQKHPNEEGTTKPLDKDATSQEDAVDGNNKSVYPALPTDTKVQEVEIVTVPGQAIPLQTNTKSKGDKESLGREGADSAQTANPVQEGNVVDATMEEAKPSAANASSLEPKEVPVVEEEPLPDVQLDDLVLLTMLALALEHTRACDVLYGLWDVPKEHVELSRKFFRMVELPINGDHSGQPMLCDLTKCSSRLAFLMNDWKEPEAEPETSSERLLVRLPLVDEAKAMFDTKLSEMQRSTRALDKTSSHLVSGATGAARLASVAIRVVTNENDTEGVKCFRLGEDGAAEEEELKLPAEANVGPPLDILRCFPISKPPTNPEHDSEDEVLKELVKKQADLLASEHNLEPRLRLLMSKVVEERLEYEKPERKQVLEEEKRILRENEKLIERRKEMDLAWQEQLEKDMNAVCNICDDGEVTPDNQILFCEACNVAIHQMCYGIEKVPEGDYYCIACRFFGRDKMQEDLASRLKRNPSATAVSLAPLHICCELCPVIQGAYIRTQTSEKDLKKRSDSKWVHMACAKWQGLQFLDRAKPEVVEDVAPLKVYFRKKEIACAICQGRRGAFHNCRYEGCEKWFHVTCARAIGTCQVVHGEDVEGPVAENPWTLMCTEHSGIDPESLTKEPVPHEQLVRAAGEFPDDVIPEPPPQEVKPFHKLNGKERAIAFADPVYEKKLMDDLITKKFPGARCEVCDTAEDDGKNLYRCTSCAGVVCVTCKLTQDDTETDKRFFKCLVCQSDQENQATEEGYKRPQCSLCFQKWGLLLGGVAKPINKLSHWKHYPKEFAKSLFAKELWAHYTCAL